MSNTEKGGNNNVIEKPNRNEVDGYSENTDEVDAFIKSSERYLRIPQRDRESKIYQFFKDKKKRKLISRSYTDPVTKETKALTKVQYVALDPYHPEQGERLLDAPKTLAVQIESNIIKGNCLQEITRYGTGPNTRYTANAA